LPSPEEHDDGTADEQQAEGADEGEDGVDLGGEAEPQ